VTTTTEKTSVKPAMLSMSRSERLMALAAGLLALCAVVVIVGLFSLSRIHESVMSEIGRNRVARIATYGLVQATIDAETGQRGYLLTHDASFLEPFASGRAAVPEYIAQLRETLEQEPGYLADLNRAELRLVAVFEGMSATIRERDAGVLSTNELRREMVESKASMDALRGELSVLLRALERRIDRVRQEERRTTDALYWIGGLLALFTMAAVGLTVLALRSERKSWSAAFKALSEANEAAEVARAQATASDLAKTRFLAVASHDMRQPLHALTLYLSALERRVETDEARGIIHKMERATNSMVTMFSTLLDLARIQAGVINPEIEEFPLQDIFDRIVAEHPGAKVEATATSIVLRSDPSLVERALRNLVSNAVKHGGGAARLSAVIAGDRAAIAVIDNGPGISEEDQKRIFDEFVRLEGRAEGLGLGLAIVKRIADLLDIPIELASSPGHGARFTLRAQLAGAGAARTPRPENPPAHLAGATVLVVDDDALAREAVAGALLDLGAVVRAAANERGAEEEIADGFVPKLLVMDLRIDGELAGVEIALRLRAKFDPPPQVIVVTGDTGPETLALLRTSGFKWLIKPVSPQDLSAAAAEQMRAA
jgi:signal transduction histidine kinase